MNPESSESPRSIGWIDLAALSFAAAVLFVLLVASQAGKSPVMDELVGPAVGVAELQAGDRGFLDVHPPLTRALQALPLLPSRVSMPFDSRVCDPRRPPQLCLNQFAIAFFYQRAVADADRLLDRARRVNQVLAVLALAAACAVALAVGGRTAGLITALIFLTSPLWIAHGRIATNDLPYSVLAFFAMASYGRFRERGGLPWLILFGVLAGLAIAAKFSAIPLVCGMAVVLLGDALFCRARFAGNVSTPRAGRIAPVLGIALAGLAALATLLTAYGGSARALIRDLLLLVVRMSQGHAAYFLGEVSQTGWTSYFPVAFLLKTPPGTLLLAALALAAGLAYAARAGFRGAWNSPLTPFIVPAGLYCATSLSSSVNIGLRYWLPLYPVLFISIGVVVARLADRPWRRLAAGAVLGANVVAMILAYPHYLSYFNAPAGGPAGGPRYLSDSNIDWGQDLRELAALQQQLGIDRLVLAYFGPAPPAAYGVRYQPLYNIFNPENPDAFGPREVPDHLAVSVTFQSGQYVQGLEWLRERAPLARDGWSIPIYDISQDAEAHRRLAEFYGRRGFARTAQAHAERARVIEADAPGIGDPSPT